MSSHSEVVATDDLVRTDEDTLLTGNLLTRDNGSGTDSETGGSGLEVMWLNGAPLDPGASVTLASGAVLRLFRGGFFEYDPNGQFESVGVGRTATDTFTYTVSNGVVNLIPGAFDPVFFVDDLDGTNGFRIEGPASEDYMGWSVAGAGRVDGADDIDDIVIGAPNADMANAPDAGAAYVLFGDDTRTDAVVSVVGLTGSTGFRIAGTVPNGKVGWAVDGAGDHQGDGLDDVLVGDRDAGAGYMIYGRTVFNTGNLSVGALDGRSSGFQLTTDDTGRWSVSGAGDLNDDGLDDFLVGLPAAVADGKGGAGAAYVVFGSTINRPASFDLDNLDGRTGFRIEGEAANDFAGWSVTELGDVNGDGIDDVLIGAQLADPGGRVNAGAAYVVFGRESGEAFDATLSLSSLSTDEGFRIDGPVQGDAVGWSVAAGGDVNGDGIDDILIGARNSGASGENGSGSVYLIFGAEGLSSANLFPGGLDGTNGVRFDGVSASDRAGHSVSSAGDVNNDGYDDVLIGAPFADGATNASGAAYVVFGRESFDFGRFPLGQLANGDGSGGFQISGRAMDDQAGLSVAAAGDINGDGIDDILVGAPQADRPAQNAGEVYVIYGRGEKVPLSSTATVTVEIEGLDGRDVIDGDDSAETLEGFAQADTIRGGGGNDTVLGGGGSDLLLGQFGEDVVKGGGGNDKMRGGDDDDKLIGGKGKDKVQGDAGDDSVKGNGQNDKLFGQAGDDTLVGGGGKDKAEGGDGDDRLVGGGGDDTLEGGAGNDWMNGGSGDDIFVFRPGAGVDTIEGFKLGEDFFDIGKGMRADLKKFDADNDGDGVPESTLVEWRGSDGDSVLILDVVVRDDDLLFL